MISFPNLPRGPLKAAVALLALLALPAQAATTPWKGRGDIVFSGTSTLHDWSGKVAAQPFTARVTSDDAGQLQRLEAVVKVKVAEMDTAEPGRDKNMRKAMRAPDFPLVTATVNAPFSKITETGSKTPSRLPFTLELLGRKHEVDGKISRWQAAGSEATFDLDFELSLKECGITVPSVLFVVRVGDTIKVHATVKLQRSND